MPKPHRSRTASPPAVLVVALAAFVLRHDAAAAPFAYVTNSSSNTVSVIDTASDSVVVTLGVGGQPEDVTVSPDGTKVYVANAASVDAFGDGTASIIDATTNSLATTVRVAEGPYGVAAAGTHAYVTNRASRTVSVIETTGNTVTGEIPLSNEPFGIAAHPTDKWVYVVVLPDCSPCNGNVLVVDTIRNVVAAMIPLGERPGPLAINPTGTRVYVANAGLDNSISVIDTGTNTVVANVPVGQQPDGIAIDPAGERVYVANACGSDPTCASPTAGTVSVIDTATNSVRAEIPLNSAAGEIAAAPDGKVYVISGSNTVSVINGTADPPDVTTTVTVGQDPFGIAVAPLTSTISTTTPRTTTTTLACTTARCSLAAAEMSPPCAGQTIPASVTAKLTKAENLIDQAATSPTRKARKLLNRARKALKQAGTTAARLAKRKKKLSADCALALTNAASHVAAGLQG